MRGQRLPSPSVECGLLEQLFASLPGWKRVRVKELLKSGRVHVNGESVRRHDTRVGRDDVLELRDEAGVAKRELPFAVLYEDAHLIAIEKPNGLLTVGTRYEKVNTAYSMVNHALRATRERALVVHRLDRYTSGVLLFAKSEEVQEAVMRNWGKGEKLYVAIVEGEVSGRGGQLEHFLKEDERLVMHASDRASPGAVKASLHWEKEAVSGGFTRLRVSLKTGKKNQIRAQLAALGYPIAGDKKYGATSDPARRLCLHAARLVVVHPKSGKRVVIESKLPRELREIVR